MKVFKMNDFDWVCAESEQQAKEWYSNFTGDDIENVESGFEGEVSLEETTLVSIDELPKDEQMLTHTDMVKWDCGWCVPRSFAWVIEHQKITEPCIIASTEF